MKMITTITSEHHSVTMSGIPFFDISDNEEDKTVCILNSQLDVISNTFLLSEVLEIKVIILHEED